MRALAPLAGELGVVIPISFFERDGPHYYNSLAMVDADGALLGRLPQEPHPRRARLPGEVLLPARRHRLPGLEDALRPTRRRHLLGPVVPGGRARHDADGRRGRCSIRPPSARSRTTSALDTAAPWQRAMQGHAVSNVIPVVARQPHRLRARTTARRRASTAQSFIADHRGDLVASFGDEDEGVLAGELRSRPRSRATAPPGASSATAAPTSTPRASSNSQRTNGKVWWVWKGAGEGTVHSRVVAPTPHGLAGAGTLRPKA